MFCEMETEIELAIQRKSFKDFSDMDFVRTTRKKIHN